MANPDVEEFQRQSQDRSEKTVDYLRDNPIVSFAEGAYSFPHDWWLGIHWILGMQGVYGNRMQRTCRSIGRDLETMVSLGVRSTPLVYQTASVALKYFFTGDVTSCAATKIALEKIDRVRLGYGAANAGSQAAGRYAGGVFTLYASTGGRFGALARRQPQKTGYMLSNLLLASVGALIKLAINTRGRGVSVIDMWVAILTGRGGPVLTSAQYTELFRAVQQCAFPVDQRDQQEFQRLHKELQGAINGVRKATE